MYARRVTTYLGQAQIVIDQATLGPGQPGVSRDDGVLAQVVTLRNYDNTNISSIAGGWNWEMEVPRGSAATLSTPGSAVTTFTPDVDGTYIITLRVNQGLKSNQIATLLFAVRDSGGFRYPGQGEAAQANWNSIYTLAPNTTGWWEDLIRILRAGQPAALASMLTVVAEPAVVNSRRIVLAAGLSAVDTGPGGTYTITPVASLPPGTQRLADVALQAENIITTRTVNTSTRDAVFFGQVNLGTESIAARGTKNSYATIGGGLNNLASGAASTIGGGNSNTASATSSAIAGGESHTASGAGASIGGGASNTASSNYSRVGGGQSNTANTGTHTTVGGGQTNNASAAHATIGGGQGGAASGAHATIGGGSSNAAAGATSFIGGGGSNSTSAGGTYGTVGGGQTNQANGSHATVGGGRENVASGDRAFIGGGGGTGGDGNTATAIASVVCGGSANDATATHAAITGGNGNVNGGDHAYIGAGTSNSIASSGDRSALVGGSGNSGAGPDSFMGAGSGNAVSNAGASSALVAGANNNVTAGYAFIGAGDGNTVSSANGAIVGGLDNIVSGDYGFVGGGNANRAGSYAVSCGGDTNLVSGSYGFCGGGRNNTVSNADGVALGRAGTVSHDGAMVFNAAGGTAQASSVANEITLRGDGGVRLITNAARFTKRLGVTTTSNYEDEVQGNASTTDATPGTSTIATIPTGASVTVTVSLHGKQISSANCKSLYYVATYTNNGGAVALTGAAHINSTQATGGAAWVVAVGISGTNLQVQYTGAAATTIRWSWSVKVHFGGQT